MHTLATGKKCFFLFLLFLLPSAVFSQDWRDRMDSVIYTPRYFGPNAFPLPEINSGKISSEYEWNVRFDIHKAKGDNTSDIYSKVYLPFGKKAAFEAAWVIREFYHTSDAIKDERFAANTKPSDACIGDVVVNAYFQLLENEKIADILFASGLKTAAGNQLVDARYTDAANYWFDLNFGRELFPAGEDASLRLVAKVGFYCYMTNNKVHRQNDGIEGGGGLKFRLRHFCWDADVRGFNGYWNRGDNLLLFHSKLQYRYKKYSLYLRFQGGLNDYIYQSYSIGSSFNF